MKLYEYSFTEYYHKYITIEADDLTELLKDEIDVHDDDCYALCSSYCAKDGFLEFNVLSIGHSWEKCTRGLRRKKMLGIFTADQVMDKEVQIAEPSLAMIKKNTPWIQMMDEGFDEDLLETRLDHRLDDIRALYFPDVVLAGVVRPFGFAEYDMHITGIKGPFLAGYLDQEPEENSDIHLDDPMWALPYVLDDGVRLLALFVGDNLSKEEQDVMNEIIQVGNKFGIDFNGFSIKS